jgi:signal transduction histidine kinase
VVIGRQLSKQLDDSLDAATLELARVVTSPELSLGGDSALLDAMDALRIPQRTLYLLDAAGRPISQTVADDWISSTALKASQHGLTRARHEASDDRTLRIVARPFRAPQGKRLVAAAIADQFELEDRYTELIGAFLIAAIAAIILVGIGGSILTRKSMEPIDSTIANMRRFMADAAHELKTPIAILRSNSEVALQQARDPDSYRATLSAVEGEARRLGLIVEHMLLLARADAGGRQLETKPIYLDDVADDCVRAMRPIAESKEVTLRVSRFEEAAILADPALIRELTMILLDNAIKYTEPGGTIELSVFPDAGRPTLTVKDTGIGIGAADLPRVFERFYRVRRSNHSAQGAGLGLSIAKWIADQHGASIEVKSEEGRGTEVHVSFRTADQR